MYKGFEAALSLSQSERSPGVPALPRVIMRTASIHRAPVLCQACCVDGSLLPSNYFPGK